HLRRFFAAEDFSRRSHLNIMNPMDARMVEDYDVVIHLAAHLDKSPEAAEQCFRVNADGTANLLRHMHANSAFIYASTKDVYGPHAAQFEAVPETCPTDYAGQSALEWSKVIGERYVEYYAQTLGFRAAIFRLSTVYAPLTEGNEPGFVGNYVEAVKFGNPVRLPGAGEPRRDLLHVDDLAQACKAFIDAPVLLGTYNVGGGAANTLNLRELMHTIAEEMGCQEVIDEADPLPAPEPMNYVSDLTKIETELGWKPEIGVAEGIRTLF
ncbi:MAG: NAD(P)-dependent oxidoreductase, partial [Pyrinomonadaceae bacterium]